MEPGRRSSTESSRPLPWAFFLGAPFTAGPRTATSRPRRPHREPVRGGLAPLDGFAARAYARALRVELAATTAASLTSFAGFRWKRPMPTPGGLDQRRPRRGRAGTPRQPRPTLRWPSGPNRNTWAPDNARATSRPISGLWACNATGGLRRPLCLMPLRSGDRCLALPQAKRVLQPSAGPIFLSLVTQCSLVRPQLRDENSGPDSRRLFPIQQPSAAPLMRKSTWQTTSLNAWSQQALPQVLLQEGTWTSWSSRRLAQLARLDLAIR
jgi:hypothetical protein